MSETAPKVPYVYQPHPVTRKDGRLWMVSGLPDGMTREEAEAIVAVLKSGPRSVPDAVCEHGTALDVHCCNCHSGFIFDADHECPSSTEAKLREAAQEIETLRKREAECHDVIGQLWAAIEPDNVEELHLTERVHQILGVTDPEGECGNAYCGQLDKALTEIETLKAELERCDAQIKGFVDFGTGQPRELPFKGSAGAAKESDLNFAWTLGYDTAAESDVFKLMVDRADQSANRADATEVAQDALRAELDTLKARIYSPCEACGGAGMVQGREQTVTLDMAIDAGDREMAGSHYGYEQEPCDVCDGTGWFDKLAQREADRTTRQAQVRTCTLDEDEQESNPFSAQCGRKFDTYEEMALHNRRHHKLDAATPQDSK